MCASLHIAPLASITSIDASFAKHAPHAEVNKMYIEQFDNEETCSLFTNNAGPHDHLHKNASSYYFLQIKGSDKDKNQRFLYVQRLSLLPFGMSAHVSMLWGFMFQRSFQA